MKTLKLLDVDQLTYQHNGKKKIDDCRANFSKMEFYKKYPKFAEHKKSKNMNCF